jgi:protein-L-isoaspartate O-methyltransferase
MITGMLQMLDVQPGNHVLEIGTGSGYSTALLAELIGPDGSIVSIDVDSEMTQPATELLTGAKYKNVLLVTADDLRADRVLPTVWALGEQAVHPRVSARPTRPD